MGVYGIVFACGRCGGALDSTAHMCSSVIFVLFHIKKKSERERGKMEAETNTTHIFAYSPLQRYIVCTVFLLITVAFNGVFSSHHLLCGCLPFLQFNSFHFIFILFSFTHSLPLFMYVHWCNVMFAVRTHYFWRCYSTKTAKCPSVLCLLMFFLPTSIIIVYLVIMIFEWRWSTANNFFLQVRERVVRIWV